MELLLLGMIYPNNKGALYPKRGQGINHSNRKFLKKSHHHSFTPFRIENAQSASPSSFISAREAGDLNEKRCKI
jgi:hypothetical protein